MLARQAVGSRSPKAGPRLVLNRLAGVSQANLGGLRTRTDLTLPVSFYFDHNVSRAIIQGLRLRGVDVLTRTKIEYSAFRPALID